MIVLTYAAAGLFLAITGWMFQAELLTATTQTVCWIAIFFVASCAASSAYLTASEIFPLEVRAMAISIFYAIGTLVGGVGAPALFGKLIESQSRAPLFYGYICAAVLMVLAASVEWRWGVAAEGQSLEHTSKPLSAV